MHGTARAPPAGGLSGIQATGGRLDLMSLEGL
jgi:hypothetical protein